MDKALAYKEASKALELLIVNQPNLFSSPNSVANNHGAVLADYCHNFIEQYAKRLIARAE